MIDIYLLINIEIMEELLNKLIKKWWLPFNVDCAWTNVEVINKIREDWYIPEHSKIIFKTATHWHVFDCDIRDLVSKWSWLWQFVCENGMVEHEVYEALHSWTFTTADHSDFWYTSWDNYEYRVIQSALCDEDKLEQFLLNSIIIDD